MKNIFILILFVIVVANISCVSTSLNETKRKSLANNATESDTFSEHDDILVCTPERFLVKENSQIRIHVWNTRDQYVADYESWNASAGILKQRESALFWEFKDTAPGVYNASVTLARDSEGNNKSCTVYVIVQQPDRAVAGRKLLVSGEQDHVDDTVDSEKYGAYSYVLMRPPLTAVERKRNKKVIEGYLNSICSVTELKEYFRPNQLNIVFMPVKIAPKELWNVACGENRGILSNKVDWILERYDFARARFLLSFLGGDLDNGPFLVTSLSPLSGENVADQAFLVQDFSWVPMGSNDIIPSWIEAFFSLTVQDQKWNASSAKLMIYKLHAVIAVIAESISDIEKALERGVKFKKRIEKL